MLYIDLGLPSGNLWATENTTLDGQTHFTFDEAVEAFGDLLPSCVTWKELYDNCTWSWDDERKGYTITGKNGNSIFLPAAGYRDGSSIFGVGSGGYYWSSSVRNVSRAFFVYFYSGLVDPMDDCSRSYGFSVRLHKKKEMKTQIINIPEGFELVQISTTTFELKKKQLPKTWEEFCKTHNVKKGEVYIDSASNIRVLLLSDCRYPNVDRNILSTKSDAEGILALMQLIQLRDCYNDGWRANWSDPVLEKYIIYHAFDELKRGTSFFRPYILSFKTSELRDTFLHNFKDLIEQAKDFI